jgi:type 1 glutamine amidotransferase
MDMRVALLLLLAPLPIGAAPTAPEPRRRADVESVLARAPKPTDAENARPLHVVLVADTKDHGPGEHDYPLWQQRWGLLLGGASAGDPSATPPPPGGPASPGTGNGIADGLPNVRVTPARQWPDEAQWKSADLVAAFCYVDWNETRFQDLASHLSRGGGFVLIHSAAWTRPGPSPRVAALAGIGGFTRWREGSVELTVDTRHPIGLGLPERIRFLDETYWPPSPAVEPGAAQVVATSDERVEGGAVATGPQPMFWAHPHGKGRVFGCVPGHFTWTFDDPYFRLLLLRGMAWAAGGSPYRFDPLVLRGARVAAAPRPE